jgi:hypothetical protein
LGFCWHWHGSLHVPNVPNWPSGGERQFTRERRPKLSPKEGEKKEEMLNHHKRDLKENSNSL